MTMTNQLEEPDSWAVIANLDLEQEIEEEQQRFLFLAAVALSFLESYYAQNSKPVRSAKGENQQLDWNDHVTQLLHENRFHHEYRMSLQAFNHLLELLRSSFTVNVVKSNASSGLYSTNRHIYPELILAIGLCWLAGRKLIDIHHVYGVSYPSLYAITQTFLDAVDSCPALSIQFPATNKEKQTVMNGFLEKTSSNYFVDVLAL